MSVSFSKRLSHRFLLAKTDPCLFFYYYFLFFFSFLLFPFLFYFYFFFNFLKWILSMPSYYFLSVPLLILFHYSLNMEGRRKRRKPNLMDLSSWNLQGHPITLLGMVSHCCHVFAGNYLWWIATLCSLQSSVFQWVFTFLPCFPIFPVAFLYVCKGRRSEAMAWRPVNCATDPHHSPGSFALPEHAVGFSWASLHYWHILQLL